MSFIVAILSALLMLCSTQQINNYVNVTTSLGTVTGLHDVTSNIEYFSFRGIPYANATRFKAPTSMKPWTSLVMATNDGAQCAQPSMFGEPLEQPTEDCLFLNVYTPLLPQFSSPDQPKLPVMVFIHGGGFMVGSSSSHIYGPAFFMAERNVILVTFNYRVGIFGFLSTGTPDAQGNAGMKDQVEALRFVKKEISYFGGDPDRVTIFGQSAGAMSVIYHILSPMSKGLFQRAIAESGSALGDWVKIDIDNARNYAATVAKHLGCNTENTTMVVTCLKAMSTSALCQASVNFLTVQEIVTKQVHRPDQIIIGFKPVIETGFDESVFLADDPVNVLNNLTEAVPLIIGTNTAEGAFFSTDNDTEFAVIDKNLKYFAPQEIMEQGNENQLNAFVQQIRKYYFNSGPVNQSTLEGLVNLLTDRLFMYSTAQTVRKLAEKNSTVYLYSFAYIGDFVPSHSITNKLGYKGVSHGDELGYLFYSSGFNNTNLTKIVSEDYQVMKRMIKLWIAFATNGTPSNSTDEVIRNIQWSKVTNASELKYLKMDTNFTSENDYYKERIALWDQLSTLQRSSALNIKPKIFLILLPIISIIKSSRFSF